MTASTMTAPAAAERFDALAKYLLMLDSVDPSVFAGERFDALAGYVPPSSWPDFGVEGRLYPKLLAAGRIVSITPTAAEKARAIDCETGDARPPQVGPWIRQAIHDGVYLPIGYANESEMPAVIASVRAAGVKDDEWIPWWARWTYAPGLTAGEKMRQWTDRYNGRNIDATSVLEMVFHGKPEPPHVNALHYEWFPNGNFPTDRWGVLHERSVVEAYDKVRPHPAGHHQELGRLQAEMWWLRQRVCYEAIYAHPHIDGVGEFPSFKPSWDVDRRGWRRKQLEKRAYGHQVTA